jgi:hypothetical protein
MILGAVLAFLLSLAFTVNFWVVSVMFPLLGLVGFVFGARVGFRWLTRHSGRARKRLRVAHSIGPSEADESSGGPDGLM